SDENLLSIAHQIRSRLFLAHVRAATGTATIRTNCHPFSSGRYLFMHNGQIGGWPRVRRALERQVPDSHYENRNGTTDSEVIFLLLLAHGFAEDPQGALTRVVDLIEREMVASAVNEPFRFTAAISDGESVFAIRYASDPYPPTLYVNARHVGGGALVVSEPIDDASIGWDAVPPQSFLHVDRAGVSVAPFRHA